LTAGSNFAGSVTRSEDLEGWDRILELEKERVQGMFAAKSFPTFPMVIRCSGTCKYDAGVDLTLHSAEAVAESICDRGWQIFHESA
jgi:hypothetical protein